MLTQKMPAPSNGQHRLNGLHVYCRLCDLFVPAAKAAARALAWCWEKASRWALYPKRRG